MSKRRQAGGEPLVAEIEFFRGALNEFSEILPSQCLEIMLSFN